jgi:hypothetical protein
MSSTVGSHRPTPPTTVEALAAAVSWLERDVELVIAEHRKHHHAGDGVGGSLRELCNYLTAALQRAEAEPTFRGEDVKPLWDYVLNEATESIGALDRIDAFPAPEGWGR